MLHDLLRLERELSATTTKDSEKTHEIINYTSSGTNGNIVDW